jgi:hypothetical protein
VASKRLADRDKQLAALTGFSSAYLIVLTVLPYLVRLPQQDANHINLFAVGLALVILVSSLLQYSKADVVNSEQHHRSALEINEVVGEIDSETAPIRSEKLKSYANMYAAILQKYSVNHDGIDYMAIQLQRPDEYNWLNFIDRFWMRLRIALATGGPIVSLVAVTAAWLWIVFGYALANELPVVMDARSPHALATATK